jgi:hypothetical protein
MIWLPVIIISTKVLYCRLIISYLPLTEAQIFSLSPDESSKKAGLGLANPLKWLTRGANEQAIWGECQGSGSKPYQTQIDLNNIAFKCSCPSRKFPCKHGIGLALLHARQPGIFTESEAPAWVTEWTNNRSEKEEKKTGKKDKPIDEAAQLKRLQAREQKVADGIEDLLVWIKDIVRNGILGMPEKSYAFWDGMAKRLVDAQAPGLAGMIRTLSNTDFYHEGWQTYFLDNLIAIYIVAKGYQHRLELDPALYQEIKNWIGFTVNQEELRDQSGVKDTWLVTAKHIYEDENFTVERNWLYGTSSKQDALVLQFTGKGQTAPVLLSPAMYVEAELVFFPSVSAQRAVIKSHIVSEPIHAAEIFRSWKDVAERETATSSAFPVRNERMYSIAGLLPVEYNGRWWLKDSSDDMMVIKEGYAGIWKLLSLSGGDALDMVVLGRERIYEPVGVWQSKKYIAI